MLYLVPVPARIDSAIETASMMARFWDAVKYVARPIEGGQSPAGTHFV